MPAPSFQPHEPDAPTRRDWISLGVVLVVQAQNAFNDNLVKFVLIGLGLAVAAGTWVGDKIQFLLSALLPLPFILFAPLAGFLADRFSKRDVIYLCLVAQLAIFIFIAVSVLARNIPLAILGFFLLSAQSAFFSPAKTGILKELVGSARLGMVNGLMQMLTMVGILTGMWLGGTWFDSLLSGHTATDGASSENAWRAALVPIGAIGGVALLPLLIGRFIRPTTSHSQVKFSGTILVQHFRDLCYLFSQPRLRLAALGSTYYWFIAYFLGLAFVSFGKELHPNLVEGGASSAAAAMTVVIGIGLALGSSLVSFISRHRNELGMVPFGGAGLALGLLGVGLADPAGEIFSLSLGFIGFAAGFYLVPLSAFIQDEAEEAHRGRVLSANNLLVSVTGIIAIGAGLFLENLGVSPSTQVLVFVFPTIIVTIVTLWILPRSTLRFLLRSLLQATYRIRRLHPENIPRSGGALLLCNHVSYIDSLILGAACSRDIRFVIVDRFMDVGWIRWFLRLFAVIPISPDRNREAIRAAAEAIRGGDLVCVFPEGGLTRTGLLNEIKRGFRVVAREAGAPVIPVYIDALWGSIFSFERGRFMRKVPRRVPYGVTVSFGESISPEEVSPSRVRHALEVLSAEAFSTRRSLGESLPGALRRALKTRPGRDVVVDLTGKRVTFPRAAVLGTAEVIAGAWRRRKVFAPEETRVGIVLPLSSPAIILEVALVLSGRVPVVFPLTSSPSAEDLASWGIRTVISTERVREHLAAFPWPEQFLDMATTFREVSRGRLLLRWLAAYLEPASLAILRPPRGKRAPGAEAAGYVHLRPDGTHELVSCTSRQIIANVEQLGAANFFERGETILSEAPAASPEGNIFSLWYPLLKGHTVVTVSLALEDKAVAKILADENVSVFLPRSGRWKALASIPEGSLPPHSLRVVLGFDRAAASPELRKAIATGLGATLAAGSAHPAFGVVLSLSMPDPDPATPDQEGSRDGAAGRLLPGIAARLLPEEGPGDSTSLGESGRLQFRGACFPSEAAWTEAGQTGRFDEDGFLYLG